MSEINPSDPTKDELSSLCFAVTGATGFVGQHLVTHLLSGGAEVAILVRDGARVPFDFHENLKVIDGDLFDEKASQLPSGENAG